MDNETVPHMRLCRRSLPWTVIEASRTSLNIVAISVIHVESQQPEYFPNAGIPGGVTLSRFAVLLKNWMIDDRENRNYTRPCDTRVREETGIVLPPESVGQWERIPLSLTVFDPYRSVFHSSRQYFEAELNAA
jgi:hypothetical protein